MKKLKPWRFNLKKAFCRGQTYMRRNKELGLVFCFYSLKCAQINDKRNIFKLDVWPRFKEKKHGNNS